MRSLLLLATFALVTLSCMGDTDRSDRPGAKSPTPKLRIELKSTKVQTPAGEQVRFSADLVNDDTKAMTIVLPGDGSESGWRTPIVRWNPPVGTGPRCGNINHLKPEEVVTLAPGKRVPLGEWIGNPSIAAAGKHKVTLELENVPDLKWNGIPLGEHDPATMKKVRDSARFKAVSNVVEVEVR